MATTKKAKAKKPRAAKYEEKLAINGSFADVFKVVKKTKNKRLLRKVSSFCSALSNIKSGFDALKSILYKSNVLPFGNRSLKISPFKEIENRVKNIQISSSPILYVVAGGLVVKRRGEWLLPGSFFPFIFSLKTLFVRLKTLY